eukprot:158018_1
MCNNIVGNNFVYLCALTACLSSILLGYDIGVMSGAIVYMERDLALTKWDEEIIIASLSFFSIIGALIGGQLAASYGRKKTIGISALLFFIGSIIMVITKWFSFIVFGRILLGIATGIGLLIAPLYTAELSPAQMRGKLVTLAEISINSGILFGYFIAWIFYFKHDDEAWRLMILFGCIPSILLFLALIIMPESPRWLIENNQINKAREILIKISDNLNSDSLSNYDSNINESTVELKIKNIQKTIKLEMQQGKSSWNEVLFPCIYKPPLVIQKSLLVGCGIAFFQQSTGIDAVVYYTPLTFRDLGLNDQKILLCTTFMGISKLFFIFIAMWLLDKIGRRTLLLTSSILMIIALIGLIISFLIGRPPGFTIFLQCFYVSAFSIGWGPICWVMISEIFPLQIRSRGMAVSTCINRLTAGFVALFFLSIKDLLTPIGTWSMFLIVSIFALIFVYKKVPETKNKTLEEITNSLIYGGERLNITDNEINMANIVNNIQLNEENNQDSNDSSNKLALVNA